MHQSFNDNPVTIVCMVLTMFLVAAKLTGAAEYSWLVALSPIAILITMLLGMFFAVLILWMFINIFTAGGKK